MVCFAFVDDTDLIHSCEDRKVPTEQLLTQAQEALTLWEGLIKATGGTLAPEKSYWYLIDFFWHASSLSWKYQTIPNTPGNLTIRGNTTATNAPRLTLQQCEPSKANETIGLWIAMDGNQIAQQNVLKAKVTEWTDKIRT